MIKIIVSAKNTIITSSLLRFRIQVLLKSAVRFKPSSGLNFLPKLLDQSLGLCIKVGLGQGDGDIRTRVWGLWTWGRETRDLRTPSMGRRDVWDGDAGTSNTGRRGRGM